MARDVRTRRRVPFAILGQQFRGGFGDSRLGHRGFRDRSSGDGVGVGAEAMGQVGRDLTHRPRADRGAVGVRDRWNLLIVRQLLVAPARFRELLDGLPGVATNLLTGRLRDLETAGVVERRLADEGNAVVYALTPWGAGLREPIDSLIRWSAPLMTRGPEGDHFRADWLGVALPALLDGRRTARRSSTVGIAVDDQLVQVRATRSGVEVRPQDGRELDAVVRADARTILGLAAGALDLDDARGLVEIEGDEAVVRALFS